MSKDYKFFENLRYEDFQAMALNQELSNFEKIGFPDAYREIYEQHIFEDLQLKLPALSQNDSIILDIGCGCSTLPTLLMQRAQERDQQLILLDSLEMLSQLPPIASPLTRKFPARYPECPDLLQELNGRVDAVIVYSVIQYVFIEGNIFDFLDKTLMLLAPGGRILIGDVPNISMRKRFFGSEAGVKHHQEFAKSNDVPNVQFNKIETKQIDDSVLVSIVLRARSAGFHAFLLPQGKNLPMSNRREDILIVRP